MRGRITTAIGILLLIILIFTLTPKSAYPTHIPGGYPYVKPKTHTFTPPTPNPPATKSPPKQLIVKVYLEGEDLNWLLKLLPTWRNQVIPIDKSFTHLHNNAQTVDKGRIANAYLSWIISNYANLAETMVFIPPLLERQESDKQQWRIPNKELVERVQHLRIPFVQKVGFASLRCSEENGCAENILPFRQPPDEFRTLEVGMARAWEGLFNNTLVPEKITSPGGSEFVVSRAQVLGRSVEEYTRYWEWLAKTKMDDDSAGAVVEKLWHVIFGRESVWCPGERECGCDVFGKC